MSFFGNQLAKEQIKQSENKKVSTSKQTQTTQTFTYFGIGRYGTPIKSYKINYQFMGKKVSSEMKCFMFAK